VASSRSTRGAVPCVACRVPRLLPGQARRPLGSVPVPAELRFGLLEGPGVRAARVVAEAVGRAIVVVGEATVVVRRAPVGVAPVAVFLDRVDDLRRALAGEAAGDRADRRTGCHADRPAGG